MRRRPLVLFVPALCGAAAAAAHAQPKPAALPQRNLLVEVRLSDAAGAAAHAAGADDGAVEIGSDGRVSGRAAGGVQTRSRDAALRSVQQLRVLNGSRGTLRLGVAEPVHWLRIGWTPQGPSVLGLGSSWSDTGRGFMVQPSWPGGDAPVTVEIEAEFSQPTTTGGMSSVRSLATLALPLGAWVAVAETSAAEARRERGTLATRELAARCLLLLEMRVSLP